MVPVSVFSTLRGAKARGAECGSGQRGSAKRSCSCRINVGVSCFHSAVYQSSRPTRACSGRRFASSEIVRFSNDSICYNVVAINQGGAAKAQPVSPLINAIFNYEHVFARSNDGLVTSSCKLGPRLDFFLHHSNLGSTIFTRYYDESSES